MSKYKKQTWSGNGPEPMDYASVSDPNHKLDFSVGRQTLHVFVNRVSTSIKNWLETKDGDLDAFIEKTRRAWFAQGGDSHNWDTILNLAFQKSGYYKAISKEANQGQIKPETKREKFNGLDLSKIKL
jgi:hypothetical protein